MGRIAAIACVALLLSAGAAEASTCNPLRQQKTRKVHKAPPTNLLDRMAILRRPKQAGDDPPYLALSGTVAIDYTRKLADGPGGRAYYLVPGKLPCSRTRAIGLGVWEFDGKGGGGGGYGDAHALVNNLLLGSEGDRHRTFVHGLVPDGVATVTVRWHGLTVQRDLTVANNFWVTRAPRGSGESGFPTTTIWRGADGHTVKSFRQPFR
jgi:hypothetical protein